MLFWGICVREQGGCPNLSRYVRAIPRTGYSAPVYRRADLDATPSVQAPRGAAMMRQDVYQLLSAKGQEICAGLLAPPGADIPLPDFSSRSVP